ncbi:TPA: P-loop NTPase [Candidatus Woesearchaeota archaeon]|nr:hypothetical protein [archaeon]HIJ11009.1 P-loop NTPase [Candidatus Woesearchaeota archaeon]
MTKFVAIVSGKGGTGKTTSALNLAHALVSQGHSTTVVDGDLATPNIASSLGLIQPKHTLNHFLRKQKSLKEITYKHDSGISLIPASPAFHDFQDTSLQNVRRLFNQLHDTADFVLVDAPSGLSYSVHQILKHVDDAIIVVNPTRSSMLDALKTIKLAQQYDTMITGILVTKHRWGRHELSIPEIRGTLHYPIIGTIPAHRKVRKAEHHNQPVSFLYPRSSPAKAYKYAAMHLTIQ